ncbi:MAG: hypothetical protein R3296_13305 [Oleiphilaceae bacterium]|nr:hypothetical protein [Oleiphilaceae bacterium]
MITHARQPRGRLSAIPQDSPATHQGPHRPGPAQRGLVTALILSSALVSACLDDDGSGSNRDGSRTGRITMVGVEGLSYQTASLSGTTDRDGRFRFQPGETLQLHLGDLPLARDVPAREFLTPMEFTEDQRTALESGGVDDTGLSSHRVMERFIATSSPDAVNLMRFLMVLDQDQNASRDNPVTITQRTINQINGFLSREEGFELDFSVPINRFSSAPGEETPLEELSAANRLIRSICFHPPGDPLCEPPPTREEIDRAPTRPDNPVEEDGPFREDLIEKKEAIEASRRAVRDLDRTDVRDFLLDQADQYKLQQEEPFYLSPEAVDIRPDDTGLHSVALKKVEEASQLANMEAESRNPDAVLIHNHSAQEAVVRYFLNSHAGDSDESTLLVNFRLPGDYRWYRKTLRVQVSDEASAR